MAQITTKFNVGDKVSTIDKETKKAVEITVGCITASINARDKSVTIHPCKPDGDVDWYTGYDEKYCFKNQQELLNYITSK